MSFFSTSSVNWKLFTDTLYVIYYLLEFKNENVNYYKNIFEVSKPMYDG